MRLHGYTLLNLDANSVKLGANVCSFVFKGVE